MKYFKHSAISLFWMYRIHAQGFHGKNKYYSVDHFSVCAADTTYRLFGAVTLGNVASATEEHDEIIEGGALAPLMNVMKKGDLETQRAISYAVCNLAATVEYRKSIVEKGGLLPIVSLACSDDADDAWCGITTIRGLSAHDYLRESMVEAGVLEPLALGAQKTKVELLREVSSTSFNLSLMERNKTKIASHELCKVILDLTKNSRDAVTIRMACGTCLSLLNLFLNLPPLQQTKTTTINHTHRYTRESCGK